MLLLIIGIIFVCIFGSFSHFLYDWTNHSKIGSILFAVNESTWEHIKIALTPTFIWTIIEVPFYYDNPNFIFAILIRALSIIIIIPTIFYGYKTLLKKSILFIDISIFFAAVITSFIIFNLILNSNPINSITSYVSLVLLILVFSSYLLLTIYPLKNIIFKDPITKKYGIKAHK